MRDLKQYTFEINPLSVEDGGGFLISFTDFSECISGSPHKTAQL
ncbi:hypothetical protein CRENPOLYSF1_150002 [Crenothrix polyspora]|uniref:Uncharacterized protein n=1 Tax=Crenothrix polyspora TaxID=360316 RepID=A0A1R4H2R6_9GAMM|nr:hypothetical protein CRENPOLYSF1_150002 [Crenothrix polyspora]